MKTPDLVIRVTAKNIAEGQRRQCFNCPIVYAVLDKYPDAQRVRVTSKTVTLQRTAAYAYAMSTRAQSFIYAFDEGREVKPSTFRLKAIPMQAPK